MRNFFIKAGYTINSKPVQSQAGADEGLIYQADVYQFASELIIKNKTASILDIGCGFGHKLEKFILPTGAAITGIDRPDRIKYCKRRHNFGHWFVDDIENPYANLGKSYDLIICADVIEHLIDPDRLFCYFKTWSVSQTKILLSTPERDLRRGSDDMGPPGNPSHVREWHRAEFQQYLTYHGLYIEDHRTVNLRSGMLTCQMALCSWEGKI